MSSTPGMIIRNWMTAGTRNALVTPCSGIARRIAAGSTSRMTTLVQPLYSPTIAQPAPAMWNIGITARFTLSGVNRHCAMIPVTWPKKLSLVSMTPLGRPVVPEV